MAVMQDVPDPRGEKMEQDVQDALVKAMSPEVRKVYRRNKEALKTEYNSSFSNRRGRYYVVGDVDFTQVTAPFMDLVNSRHKAQRSLERIAKGCSTLKQLQTQLPEFIKYMPTEQAPTSNLPAIANVVSAFTALGWKPI